MFTNLIRRSSLRLTTAVLFIAPAAAVAQTTWYVDVTACPNAGTGGELDPFCNIQDGMNASTNGDTVLVLPGTYNEAIDFVGKAITLRAREGAEATTLDATGQDTSVVSCRNSEGPDTVLDGFTITGGSGTQCPMFGSSCGGGMYLEGASATVRNCRFVENTAGSGGGMYIAWGNPTASNCFFQRNTARGSGGGVAAEDGSLTLTDCTLEGNVAGEAGGGFFTRGSEKSSYTSCSLPLQRQFGP